MARQEQKDLLQTTARIDLIAQNYRNFDHKRRFASAH